MGIKNVVKKIGDKAGSTVSKLASLSSEELERLELSRDEYLLEMPDPEDETSLELTGRLLAASSVEIYNAYLSQIKELYKPVRSDVEYDGIFKDSHNIRYINITKWVTNKEENSLEKLINVYQVLSNDECNIALVFNRKKAKTNVYLAITNTLNEDNNTNIDIYKARIADAIRGNFPGAEFNDEGVGVIPCLDNDLAYSVATASNVPAEKSEKFISQTIEKLLDGIVPRNAKEEYTIILLATPILDVEQRKMQLADFYTALSPYAAWQTDFHFTDAKAFGSAATIGVNVGASAGVQRGTNQNITDTDGITDTTSKTDTDTVTKGESSTKGSSDTVGGSIFGSGTVSAGFLGTGASATGGASVDYHHGWNRSKTKTSSTAKSVANTLGKAVTKSVAKTAGSTLNRSLGANFGANFARTSTVTATVSKNEGISQTHTNYSIKHTLDLLEKQMKRYEQSVALGMWDFAAYILSEDSNIASNVAHSYVALTQGEESYMSEAAINLWRGDLGEDSLDVQEICKYLRNLRHPMFGLNPGIVAQDATFNVYPTVVTATTALSGKELAYSLNFPRKSISGLPVIECVEFGRNISSYEGKKDTNNIRVGDIFHMNHTEPTEVTLDVDSLASHVFITGSTGTGKSNTVYKLLRELRRKEVKFLVVEPVKGEYKNVFGNRKDVHVYGTNPKKTDLLKINPFSFPNDIHVLEHIDRLIEIFNVCWPMYAAMPAVLKNAIEKSYEDCGWNLTKSENEYNDNYYPTFYDVARNIKEIINSSEYDDENKGAYKGSLLTRLQSLSNGINGLIFTKEEIPFELLFDENVIVDLSRVGSTETKSLLMGMLVLKLQEYRTSHSLNMNSPLKHVTVLEEAHNILKKSQASNEGSNLIAKSVEMISNSIAEMRTYGEGFFIVDQAPGLLDESVIRNTNTKIIMRLPHQLDRELVGTAANLNEYQIQELARLPKGVAAIYQNDWIQSILCKVQKVQTDDAVFNYESDKATEQKNNYEICLEIVSMISNNYTIGKEITLKDVKETLDTIDILDSTKASVIKLLSQESDEIRMTKLSPVISEMFDVAYNAFKGIYSSTPEPKEWTMRLNQYLVNELRLQMEAKVRRDIIQGIITQYLLFEVGKPKVLEDWKNRGNLR